MKAFLIKHKFLLMAGAFLVYLTFFDKNNLIGQIEARHRYGKMLEERDYYTGEVKKLQGERNYLFNIPDSTDTPVDRMKKQQALEKFGRENYLMKKDNEDIFVIRVEED